MIVLIQDENDKRTQRIITTEKTKALAEKYTKKEMEFMQLLFDGISDEEIRSVFKIISRMEKNIKKADNNSGETK